MDQEDRQDLFQNYIYFRWSDDLGYLLWSQIIIHWQWQEGFPHPLHLAVPLTGYLHQLADPL
jgi:hypothetical protein